MNKTIEFKAIDEYGEEFTDQVTEIRMKDLKKSKEEFFKLSPTAKAVYGYAEYDRSSRDYAVENYSTGNVRFVKPNRKIYVGMYF
tara:strand:- start:1183 stop:1437 length:255 start_codon:yes stop_codon:yes gene_type:complete